MKMCGAHWEKLRAAIAARSLDVLVSQDGHEAHRRTLEQLQGDESSRRNFDPLLGAYWAIASNALQRVGLDLMLMNEDGTDRCPLCFMNAGRHQAVKESPHLNWDDPESKTYYDPWIENAADGARDEAVRLGLVAQG